MFILPLGKDFLTSLKMYLQYLDKSYDKVFINLDIQNLSLAMYDPKMALAYLENDELTPIKIFENFMYDLAIRYNQIVSLVNKPVYIVLYTDIGRNIFNQNFIKEWKEDRKKAYVKLQESDPVSYSHLQYAKSVVDTIIDVLFEIAKSTYWITMFKLSNIDSDFIPYLNKLVNPNALNIIISADHDYIHMLQDDILNIRYITLARLRNKLGYSIDNKHTVSKYIIHRYKTKPGIETELMTKYYQVFHTVIGDSSDSVKSLIPRKGLKFWLKYFIRDIDLSKLTIDEIRQYVLNDECFIPILCEDKQLWKQFRQRMILFDFYFVSNMVVNKDVYNKILNYFPYQQPVIDDMIKDIKQQTKKEIKTTDYMYNEFINLGFDKQKAEYISKTFWR